MLKNVFKKKGLYTLMTFSLISLTTGCGSSGGASPDDPSMPINASAQITKSLPAHLLDGQTGIFEAVVGNSSQVSALSAGVGASCPSIVVTGVLFEGDTEGTISIDYSSGVTTVGANAACWDGSQGATLACGQTCTQDITVMGRTGASLKGDFKLIVSGSGQTETLKSKVDTTVVGIAANSDNFLSVVAKPEWGPNQTVVYQLSNVTSQDLEDLYIDLTDLKEKFPEIFSAIDFDSLQGGAFDPETNRINIGEIDAAQTIEISFYVDGSSQEAFNDGDTEARFINQSAGIKIAVDGMAPMSEDSAQIKINALPMSVSDASIELIKQGAAIIQNREQSGEITSQGVQSDLPMGITVSGCDAGTQLDGGESCTLTFEAEPEAQSGSSKITINFEDQDGVEYTQDIQVVVNPTTVLYNNQTVVAQRAYAAGTPKITDVAVINAGAFEYTMPQDLTQIFNIVGPSADKLTIVPSNQVPSCVGFTLTPQRENPYFGNECYIAIQSNDPTADLGNYRINTIALNNVKAGVLSAFNLQQSFEGLDAEMTNLLPLRINTDKTGLFTVKFTNTGATALTVGTIAPPINIQGATLTLQAGAGLCAQGTEIPVGGDCTLSYTATGAVGDAISGEFAVSFTGGAAPIDWQSVRVNSVFHDPADLPVQTFAVMGVPNFQPGNFVNILVRNDSIRNLQSLTLDLSAMADDLFSEIDAATFQGGHYDSATKTVTMTTDLLYGQTHLFQFKLNKSAATPLANPTILAAISDNPSSGYITLTAVNAQDLKPAVNVQETAIHFAKNALNIDQVGYYPVLLNNTSNDNYTIAVSDLPEGVTVSGCDDLPAGGACTLVFNVDQTASATDSGTVTITLAHDGNEQIINFPVTIQGVKLTRSNERPLGLYRKLAGGDNPKVDIVLKNIGGFDLQSGLNLADMFELRNANNVVVNAGFDLDNGSIACTAGVEKGHQCVLTIRSTDEATDLGVYELFTKATGNLLAQSQPLASFELYDGIEGFVPETLSTLPANLITGQEAVYTAVLVNESDNVYQLSQLDLPSGVNFATDTPAAGGNCWNGSDAGATLEHGQECVLTFTLTDDTVGGKFEGPMTLTILNQQSGQDFQLQLANFDTTYVAADDVSVQSNASIDDATTLFAPNTIAHKQINNPTVALNNAVLDLSGLSADLYGHIAYVKVGARQVELPTDSQMVKLGPVAVGSHRLDIKFDGGASAALAAQKDALEDNPTTQLVAISAANQAPLYPNITVSTTPVEIEETLIIQDLNPHQVSFSNLSNVAVTVVDIKSALPTGVSITDVGSCGIGQTIQPQESCTATLQADQTAYGEGSGRLDYTDSQGNTFYNLVEVKVMGVAPEFTTNNPIVTKVQNAGDSVITNIQINAINSPFNWRLATNLNTMFTLDGAPDPITNGLSIVNPVDLPMGQKSCASGDILSGDSCWIGIRSAVVDAEQTSYTIKTVADPIAAVNVQPDITVGQFILTARANVSADVDESWNNYLRTKRIIVTNNGEVPLDDLAWNGDTDFNNNFDLYNGTNGGLWCDTGACPDRCDTAIALPPEESCYIYVRAKDNIGVGANSSGNLTITGNLDQSKTFAFTNNAYLYAIGSFRFNNDTEMRNIAKFDGAAWSSVGGGVNQAVDDITVSERGKMVFSGTFTASGDNSVVLNHIATWNGSELKQFADGLPERVSALAWSLDQQNLYVSGFFPEHLLVWDGTGFNTVANSRPEGPAFKIYQDPISGDLYIGGFFYSITTNAGTVEVSNVASYNPTTGWTNVGQDLFRDTAEIYEIVRINDDEILIAGQFEPFDLFDAESQYWSIAKWNPTTQTTSQYGATGGGYSHTSVTLAPQVYQVWVTGPNAFYAVGNIANINDQPVDNIIQWDQAQNQWIPSVASSDPSFFANRLVQTMVVDTDDNAFFGGAFDFDDAGTTRYGVAQTTLADIEGNWDATIGSENIVSVKKLVISYELSAEAQ